VAGSQLNQVLSPPTTTTSAATLFRPHHATHRPTTTTSPHHQTVLVPSFQPVFDLYSYWQQQQQYHHQQQQQQQEENHHQQTTTRPEQPAQYGDHQQVCKPVQSITPPPFRYIQPRHDQKRHTQKTPNNNNYVVAPS
jgi:hypothetical protein